MSDVTLENTVSAGFAKAFIDFNRRVQTMADKLATEQFWSKPFPYGNSFGNLVLHIDGNLNYYLGAQILQTGYVRNRDLEFAPVDFGDKTATLKQLSDTVDMVVRSLAQQSESDWSKTYQAVGVDDIDNRFEMYLRCAAHFHHHIGQMTYIVKEWTNVPKE